ncbi:hypothetical protein ACFLYF_02745 [Chloroflexota bacterium]
MRPSGTEPKIRVTAEAVNEERLRYLYQNGIEAIQACLKPGGAR